MGSHGTDKVAGLTVAIVAGGGDDIRYKGTDNESYIDSAVCEEDEPPVASAGFQLARGLGTAHGASRILATYANTDEETPVSGQWGLEPS